MHNPSLIIVEAAFNRNMDPTDSASLSTPLSEEVVALVVLDNFFFALGKAIRFACSGRRFFPFWPAHWPSAYIAGRHGSLLLDAVLKLVRGLVVGNR